MLTVATGLEPTFIQIANTVTRRYETDRSWLKRQSAVIFAVKAALTFQLLNQEMFG